MAQALSSVSLGSRDDVASRDAQCVTTTLAVEGMHCGGCMRKVELALAAIPGVISARANLSARRVTAVHRATGVTGVDLVEALSRIGFQSALLPAESADHTKALDQALLKRVGIAGFAAANIMLLSVSIWSGTAGDMGNRLVRGHR